VKALRFALAALLLPVFILTACAPQATPTPAPQPTSAPTDAPTSAPTTAPTEAPTDVPTAEPTPRVIEHIAGETTLEGTPGRIFAIGEEWLLADLLALGIKPIGATVNVPEAVPGLSAEDLDGIQLYSSQTMDLETLTALEPDLIIIYHWYVEAIGYDLLSQIAPTIVLDGTDPYDAYIKLAEIFEQGDTARAEVTDFEARLAAAHDALPGGPLSVATIYPGAALAGWVDGPTAVPQMLLDLGYTLQPGPDYAPDASNGRAWLSLEALPDFNADTLILIQTDAVEGEPESLAEVQANPLYQTLPAVQTGNVHFVDRLGYPGFHGRERLLDDLVAILEKR
jgi:iron complex transport system substrate-binding protein